MTKTLRSNRTHANVFSTCALILVISGGVAYVAAYFAKNSVAVKQLTSNSVTTTKIKNEAVTTEKLKNGSGTSPKLANGSVGAHTAGQLRLGGKRSGWLLDRI